MQEVVDLLESRGHTLSKAALSKYETEKNLPRARSLWNLAKVFECSVEYLMSEPAAQVKWLRFRKKTKLSKRTEQEVKERTREILAAQIYLESAVGETRSDHQLPTFSVSKLDDAEEVAAKVRATWQIGAWPIESVTAALESAGVSVVSLEAVDGFDGLSGFADDSLPFVVTKLGLPVDRARMNLCHEFGHLTIEPSEDGKMDEAFAFRFAAALLMPATVVLKRIGRMRRAIDMRELLILKEEFGISIQALIRRCYDLAVISERQYRLLNMQLRSAGWYRNEPGSCRHVEESVMLQSLMLRALSEGLVSEADVRSRFPTATKLVDHLESESDWRWRQLESAPQFERDAVLRAASREAEPEYRDQGSLAGLEVVDELIEY